jgi:multiple sugar transport system substrate-binding protein
MMDEREQREFQAGLSEEVDAWLRGETSRRTFLTRMMVMGGAAALPGLGFTASGSSAWAEAVDLSKVELADPSTPLGRTQAAAVKASIESPKDGSAFRAVAAAQKYKGKDLTLNMSYEGGLQALEPKNFSGPLWQSLTGINFNVVELPHPDPYSKPIAEHIANSGAYDILDIEPAWIPGLANGGAIVPIDDYVGKLMNPSDLDDYHPLYKSITLYKGKRWGVFDDGDQLCLYYRKDVFDDPKLQAAYQAKFKKKLEIPKTWEDYGSVAQFITDQLAPNVYGAAHFRKAGSPGNQFCFLQEFRANGGKFF